MVLLHRDAFIGSLCALVAIGGASLAPPTQESDDAPKLQLPVACEVGKSCLIQKLADHDSGPGRRDYRCGLLTTDGHDGVDIRLRTMQDMAQGYAVLAAAGGIVLRIRDGEPDISARQRTDRGGKDAGNGVVIDHGNGWETQYSHLKMGSIAVRPGQRVVAGTRLGQIGLSGNSEFPHLHFSVRHSGKPVDPFTAGAIPGPCSEQGGARGLWAPATAQRLGYTPTAAITVGLASRVPPREVTERAAAPTLEGSMAPLILWADVIGARDGDEQLFSIRGPAGTVVHQQSVPVSGGGLSWFAYSGKRPPATGWPKGRYDANYVLKRAGRILINEQLSTTIP